jgi:hypothetical protein
VHLLDAGHFALETHSDEIAALIHEFLGRVLPMGNEGTETHSMYALE